MKHLETRTETNTRRLKMKSGKFVMALLTCATSSVFAQDSPQCESANLDQGRNIFTVVNPASGAVNQQCFLTVQPSGSTAGRYTEGNYEILLSGGGGGGGGGSTGDDRSSGGGGQGGTGAVPSRTNTYLKPGVYRLTMGTGGLGGGASGSQQGPGGNAGNGNPTGVAEAYTGETIAGFPRAEQWARSDSYQVATGRGGVAGPSSAGSDSSGPRAPDGANGSSRRDSASESGFAGGHGFIKLTQLTQAPQAVTPAPAEVIPQQAPAPVERPIRKDRN
jgi:hypothetical protein